METHIQKWGNSLGVRLPKHLAEKQSLKEGSRVLVTETKTGIAIEMVKGPVVTLDQMVRNITKETLHGEADFGKRVGNELW